MKCLMHIAVITAFAASLTPVGNATAQDHTPLAGCDCPTVTLNDAYGAAALVFEGVPVTSDTVFTVGDLQEYPEKPIDHVNILFRVNGGLKGTGTGGDIMVSTSFLKPHCAFRFIMGQSYLVFAQKQDGVLFTDRCMPTRAMDTVSRAFTDSLAADHKGQQRVEGVPPIPPGQ